jgi:isopenicillin N synthase-like dioxygenase
MADVAKAGTATTVDISPFSTDSSAAQRLAAGQALVQSLHRYGFVKVTGHGFVKEDIDEALAWIKKMFDLPVSDKMKAPHPPGRFPHRGYSGVGQEKVYSQDELATHDANGDVSQSLRKILDFKVRPPFYTMNCCYNRFYTENLTSLQESYEIGSEEDSVQKNIWLPDEVLPNFRSYMDGLYRKLAGLSEVVLDAIGVGLGLEGDAYSALMQLKQDYQLRLLHYPAISKQKLQDELLTRLPPHKDWW